MKYYRHQKNRRRRTEKPSPLEFSTKEEKTQPRPLKMRNTDIFTQLCQTELHVECVKEYRFHPVRKWRFDYALPEYKIALEVEGGVWTGGRHTSSQGFIKDMEKYNTAALMGWRLLRCVPKELNTMRTIDMIRDCMNNGTTDINT